jgi:hypothetical protein
MYCFLWSCLQQSLDGNLRKSSALYDNCLRSIKPAWFVKFLDALEHSKNFPALLALDPGRKINPVPEGGEIRPLEPTRISPFDVACILHDKLDLPEHLTVLKNALDLDEGDWYQFKQIQFQKSPLDALTFAIRTWSDDYDLSKPTVGILCASLSGAWHLTAEGKGKQ